MSALIFNKPTKKIKQLLFALLGSVLGIALRAYPGVISYIGDQSLILTQEFATTGRIVSLLAYCSIILAIIARILYKRPKNNQLIGFIGILIFVLVSALVGTRIGVGSVVLYYLAIATAEELLKFFGGSLLNTNCILKTDTILRVIIVALGFSFIENILYMLPVADRFLHGLAVITNRGAIGFLMHSIFTGIIAYIGVKSLGNRYYGLFVGLLLGVTIHLLYNLSISYQQTRLMILLIVIGYGTLSFLLYNTDSLYLKQ